MIALADQRIKIIKGGDFNDADYWLISPKGQAKINNASISDGKLYLMVNETHGHECFSPAFNKVSILMDGIGVSQFASLKSDGILKLLQIAFG